MAYPKIRAYKVMCSNGHVYKSGTFFLDNKGNRRCYQCVAANQARNHHHKQNIDVRRAHDFRVKYGMSAAQVGQLLSLQGGLCAICAVALPTGGCVDHDHNTGKVRGLLCEACNHGIARFHDDPTILRAAIAYLQST